MCMALYQKSRLYLIRAPPTFVGGALLFSDCPSVHGHSNSVIFNRISSKFHIWIASINFNSENGFCATLTSILNTGFVRHPITKMADKMAATYQNLLSWSLSVIFYWISSKFHVWIALIKLVFKFEYKCSPRNNIQDGRQNGRHLSICFCGQSTLIIYYPITAKFHIKLSVCPITKMATKNNQDGRQNGRHLSVYTCGHSNLVIYRPISSKFHI